MRNLLAVVLGVGMVLLSGCAFADWAAGIERDDTGTVVKVHDTVVNTARGLADVLLPGGIGAAASGAIATAIMLYRHKRIVASGGKDANVNGIPDEQEKPSSTPT